MERNVFPDKKTSAANGGRKASSANRSKHENSLKRKAILGKKIIDSSPLPKKVSERVTEGLLPDRQLLRQLLTTVKAVRSGDFSVRMPVEDAGIVAEIGEVLNDIIELNDSMAAEFFRVRNTVGLEGRMNERVNMGSVKGAWATSVNSVNLLIGDLVQPTIEVARVITSVAKGDLSQKMSLEMDSRPVKGEFLRIGTTVNNMVDQLNSFASEVTRVAKEVGTEGKLGGQAQVKGVSGVWKDLTDNVNGLAGNLTDQVRNIAKVTTAV